MTVAIYVLLIVLIVVAIGALGVAIWALLRAVDTLGSMKRLADDTDRELLPLVAKTDATLDLLSAEIMRVDVIVDQVQDLVATVQEKRRQAEDAVDRAVDSTAKVGRVIRDVFTSAAHRTTESAQPPQPAAPSEGEPL